MIHQKCSRLHHASGATAGTKAATLTTEGYQMLVAAALAAHAQKTVLQSTTRQVVLELARYVPWQKTDPSHSAASETQASTALPVGTTVSVRAYAAHKQAQHQASCPAVEVPSNASLRDLLSFSLTVLQVHSKRNFNLNS